MTPITAKRARDRQHDAKRYTDNPWRRWYQLKVWSGEGGRRETQLAKQPLCERHLAQGLLVPATAANHKTPHRGDWELFIAGDLESVCAPCHDTVVRAEEARDQRKGVDASGKPLDPAHPWNLSPHA